MQVEALSSDEKKKKITFSVSDTDVSFVNALRRIALEDVPTLAIEDVEVRKNSSVLYDEIVAHRLGLIPLTTDLSSYTLPSECKCEGEGCANCTLTLTLKSGTTGYVYASEIHSADPKVKPVYPETPIVKLIKGQKVELEMKAKLGTGAEHAKWAPGHVVYAYQPSLKITATDKAEEIAARFPDGMVQVKAGKLVVDEKKLFSSRFLDVVDQLSEGAIQTEDSDNSFIVTVESWGQLAPEEIATEAANVFEAQLKGFQKAIKDI